MEEVSRKYDETQETIKNNENGNLIINYLLTRQTNWRHDCTHYPKTVIFMRLEYLATLFNKI